MNSETIVDEPRVPRLDHAHFEAAVAAFSELAKATGRPGTLTRLKPWIEPYRSRLYRLVMIGEEKRGKTSLVCGLLDTPRLLPIGTAPTTSRVIKVVHGPTTECRVFFLPRDLADPDGSRPGPIDVPVDELAAYGTEHGNPGNGKGVDFIVVQHPNPLLAAGLVIIDLPGLGGLNDAHELAALEHLTRADAALFVVDSVSGPLRRDEVGALRRLRELTRHVIMVQTKIDMASTAQWQGTRDTNLSELRDRLGLDERALPYFPVSTALKFDHHRSGDPQDLADSGFAPLLALLRDDLLPRKLDRLAMRLAAPLADELAGIAGSLESELTISAASSEAELDRIESALASAKATYDAWKSSEMPRVVGRFKTAFADARHDVERRIMRDLEPSERGPVVGPIIEELLSGRSESAAALGARAGAINARAITVCAERLNRIGVEFENRIGDAFVLAAEAIGQACALPTVTHPGVQIDLPPINARPRSGSKWWNAILQSRGAALMGSGAGLAVVGALSVVFPVTAVMASLIVSVGSLLGVARTVQEVRQRDRESVEQQLRHMLVDTVRRVQQQARHEFGIGADRRSAVMLEAMHEAVIQRDSEDQAALGALAERRRAGIAKSADRTRQLRSQLAQAGRVIEHLRSAGVPLGEASGGRASA